MNRGSCEVWLGSKIGWFATLYVLVALARLSSLKRDFITQKNESICMWLRVRISPGMLDYFAILGVSRRASLSLDAVRAAFQERGAAVHPDAVVDGAARAARAQEFQLANEAFTVGATLRTLTAAVLMAKRPPASVAFTLTV